MNKIGSVERIRAILDKEHDIVCTSGGFDPMHCGHVVHLHKAKQLAVVHVTLVNHDAFLVLKKGRAFMPLEDRCIIVAAHSDVDFVVPCYANTVDHCLRILKPRIFAKGGDRDRRERIPEWETCIANDIEVIFGVDDPKYTRSSSKILEGWKAR